ncbi:rhomboid family intramembrane serine protease [Jannaschia marina]|uniref:rhomboid family intramembrane serine protease n=1 Tax=Jannaschia marina TaxID=2741674 RepID=UPI0015CE003D|nr:rhomboid family intramembrane serine protease [Jannaschia marina]
MADLGDAILGVLRHGGSGHLLFNLVMIAVGGAQTERAIGSLRMLGLAALCAGAGTLAQYAVTGPAFVGASGIAYGLVCHGLLAAAGSRARLWLIAGIMAVLFLEALFLFDRVSVVTHAVGALIGGSNVMFGSLFGSKGPVLKPMKLTHAGRVAAIIEETDEDDALEAEQGFLAGDLEGMFVLMRGGEVIGVTGYALDEQVPDVAWLSWTYLTEAETGAGLGGWMLNALLGKLKALGIRKLFIATSDYAEDGVPIYAAAHRMYEEFGAEIELTVPDYHAPGEARIVYGLENPEFEHKPEPGEHPEIGLAITGAAREPETDGTAGLIWEGRPAGIAGLDDQLEKVRRDGARMAVLVLPSDISEANAAAFESHAFGKCGRLSDYFARGLHQDWWSCSLEADRAATKN